jgi:ribonuclease T1
MTQRKTLVGLLVALAMTAFVWWTQGDEAARTDAGGDPSSSPSASVPAEEPDGQPSGSDGADAPGGQAPEGTDPESGLPWIAVDRLPPEAHDTLATIDSGGPYPYEEDDTTFQNREGILPDHEEGYYREYTVETPGLDHRGALRIVTGSNEEYYWTDDHYSSFSRIAR